ncbi:MAG: FtsX-like permease family protein [Balneolaceae bacterium]|nr:FtsX-like permease family protein [Balneolaceae bacterium]
MFLKLAWRNIWRNKRRTLITISSVMFAVVFALFLESIERGGHNLMVDNMTRFHTGYLQVQDYRFEDEPSLDNSITYDSTLVNRVNNASGDIEFTLPRLETFMLAAGQDQTRGAMVLGIDPDAENRMNNLRSRLVTGSFFTQGSGSVVLGEGLASRLELAVNDTLVLLGQGRFGMTASGKYPISGLVNHPVRSMSNQLVYISLEDAQWLTSAEDQITSLLIMPENVGDVESVAASLRREFEDENYRILTWRQLIPELVEALEFDRASTKVYMGILYVIIGFGIFGTILTMTLERMREFGILLSIGMHRLRLAVVVFLETFMISIIGVFAGFGLGTIILWYFRENPIRITGDAAEIIRDYGMEPIMPTAIAGDIYIWQGMVVFVLTLIISLYPSIKIGTLNILDASRK